MQHLFFFYFLVTIAVGIVSATIAVISYAKTRTKLSRAFIYLHSALSLMLVVNALFAYAQANLSELDPILFRLLDYLDSPIAVYLLMFILPIFIHELMAVPDAASRNRLFARIVGLLYVVYNLLVFIAPVGGALERAVNYSLDHAAFLGVMAGCFATGLRRYSKLIEGDLKRLCKRFLILFGLSIPMIVHDKLRLSSMHFLPLLYCCLGALFSHYFIVSDSSPTAESEGEAGSSPSAAAVPEAESFLRYDVSPREREIVVLVLKGYSYRAIAQELSISVNTVKAHIRSIYPKIGVTNRYELMVLLSPKAGSGSTTQR
jgi:DNA-binding CsgD family transcriptional regulator